MIYKSLIKCPGVIGAAFLLLFISACRTTPEKIVVKPREYPHALRNPLKGFRAPCEPSRLHPFSMLTRQYIKWNQLEDKESDGIEKIRSFCDESWWQLPQKNIKVIPRVCLHWPVWAGGGVPKPEDNPVWCYWPSDIEPGDYSSEKFKSRLVRLIHRLGQCWDNDPRVAYIEMAFIGAWGEHHTPELSEELQKLMGDAFQQAFKNKLIMHRKPDNFTDYKFGIHWDGYAHILQENQARLTESLYDGNRWKYAVMGGEVSYNWNPERACWGANPNETLSSPDSYNCVVDYIRRLHTNHLGWISRYNYNDPNNWTGADAVQKALGYRFVIEQFCYPSRINLNEPFEVEFIVRNTGSSPFYYNWPVEISLLNLQTRKVVWKGIFNNLDIRQWLPGERYSWAEKQYLVAAKDYKVKGRFAIAGGVENGEYIIALSILDPAGMLPSARFAIENYFTGGKHPLGYIGFAKSIDKTKIDDIEFDDPKMDKSLHYCFEPDCKEN